MSTKIETENSGLDIAKIVAAVLIVLAALVAYYQFAEISRLVRIIGVVVATGVAGFLFLLSEQGKAASAFVKDAQIEIRKVVWPTRKETVQTTGFVITVVMIAAVILWVLDWILGAIVSNVIG